jgi:Fe-S oxidoreductase
MQEIHYWGGCTFRARYPDEIEDHIDLLKMLGYDVKRIDDEGCCGYPLVLAGESAAAKAVAERASRGLRGVKVLTTECPGCYRVFRDEYPRMGLISPNVYHLTQIMAKHAERLKTATKDVVGYHDPCDLGRLGGEYRSPREALGRVAHVIEPLATRELSSCCGAGGLLLTVAPELSIRIGESRIEEDVEPAGITRLITACPSCLFNLTAAAARREVDGKGIEVLDLASYVYRRLKGND